MGSLVFAFLVIMLGLWRESVEGFLPSPKNMSTTPTAPLGTVMTQATTATTSNIQIHLTQTNTPQSTLTLIAFEKDISTPTTIPNETITSTTTSILTSTLKPQLTIDGEQVNIRSGPGTDYFVIGTTVLGQEFTVIGRTFNNSWWQVCCLDEQQGWVWGQLVKVKNIEHVPLVQDIPPSPLFIYIPEGNFLMGTSNQEAESAYKFCLNFRNDCLHEWFKDEQGQHSIYIKSFFIMRTEVTNKMYSECVTESICTIPDNTLWNDPRLSEHPVTDINWYQAVTYANWIGKRLGMNGRLPTEAEWEKAARGTDARIFPWGSDWHGVHANYCDQLCNGKDKDETINDGYSRTAPVDKFPEGASPYGLLNMAGNVWEWTSTLYDQGYPYPYTDNDGREATEIEGYRVVRGGSNESFPLNLRVSARRGNRMTTDEDETGFRVALDIPKP